MTKSLRQLANEELVANLKALKVREDKVLVEILEHIQEFERRQLFQKLGYASLYSYLREALGYSENEAYRRIESARFLKINPELKPLVNEGRLTLTSISEIRSAVKSQEKVTNQSVSPKEQAELAKAVAGCSKQETQKILADKIPDYKPVQFERKLELQDGGVQITLRLTKPQRIKSEKTKDIMARSGPVSNTAGLFERLCDFFLKKKDLSNEPPTQRLLSGKETVRQSIGNSNRSKSSMSDPRKIPMPLRRKVFRRDRGRCQFKRPNGEFCNETYNIEIDHIIPVSKGGLTDENNLRCLCRAHNQWKADKIMN